MVNIDLQEIEKYYKILEDGHLYCLSTNKQLKENVTQKGYLKVYIKPLKRSVFLHRIICLKYHPNKNYLSLQVNHIDGDKTNNVPSNLEWCTNKENTLHAIKIGLRDHLDYSGENNPSSKLSKKQAILIIQDLLNHKSENEIAKNYNITKGTVSAIKNKRLWKDLTKNIEFDLDYKRKSRSPLTLNQVKEIIKYLLLNLSYKDISNLTGAKISAIKDIKHKRTWKDLTQDIIFN